MDPLRISNAGYHRILEHHGTGYVLFRDAPAKILTSGFVKVEEAPMPDFFQNNHDSIFLMDDREEEMKYERPSYVKDEPTIGSQFAGKILSLHTATQGSYCRGERILYASAEPVIREIVDVEAGCTSSKVIIAPLGYVELKGFYISPPITSIHYAPYTRTLQDYFEDPDLDHFTRGARLKSLCDAILAKKSVC